MFVMANKTPYLHANLINPLLKIVMMEVEEVFKRTHPKENHLHQKRNSINPLLKIRGKVTTRRLGLGIRKKMIGLYLFRNKHFLF
jgi:hypothetical protein